MTLPITSERLILRRISFQDISNILDFITDPSMVGATTKIEPTHAGVKAYIDQQNAYQPFQEGVCYNLAVELNEERKFIGLLSLTCQPHQQAEMCFALSAAHRGHGLATEAVYALIQYGFNELNLHRIYATISSTDPRSWRVMERTGMRQEARLRHTQKQDGEWVDTYIYAILNDQWQRAGSPTITQLPASAQPITPWKTLERTVILEHSKFLTVESHRIALPDGRIIDDWAWVMIPGASIVLAETVQGKFLCFHQYKYAVGTTLAPVGGIIEQGEQPLQAAQRELQEETGYVANEWIHLGSFQMDPNRGVAEMHLYFARGASYAGGEVNDDLEEQHLLQLTRAELEAALINGEFKVQMWTATVAMTLLYLMNSESQLDRN